MSSKDQIRFKDIQPQREGQELSSLPAPDQPHAKYSSCKSRRIFKVVVVGELVQSSDASRLRWSHRKKKSPNLSIYFFSSEEIYIISETLISLFHRRQKGYLRTGVQPRLQTSVESASLLPVKRNYPFNLSTWMGWIEPNRLDRLIPNSKRSSRQDLMLLLISTCLVSHDSVTKNQKNNEDFKTGTSWCLVYEMVTPLRDRPTNKTEQRQRRVTQQVRLSQPGSQCM